MFARRINIVLTVLILALFFTFSGKTENIELGSGITWHPNESYTDLAMATRGSARAEVTVDEKTQGIIMEAGATGAGVALYMHDGFLYFQVGKGNEFPAGKSQALICVMIKPGRHIVEWSTDQTKTVLRVDGAIVGVSKESLRVLAGNDPGGIGRLHGGGICHTAGRWWKNRPGEFTGTIHSVTVWPDKAFFF